MSYLFPRALDRNEIDEYHNAIFKIVPKMNKQIELSLDLKRKFSDFERGTIIDQNLPYLGNLSGLQISSTQFDPVVRQCFQLTDDEKIFLVFEGRTFFPDKERVPSIYGNWGGPILFTDEKLVFSDGEGRLLFYYSYGLSISSLDEKEKNTVGREMQKISKKFSKEIHAYPIDYDVIYDMCYTSGYSLKFKRKDRPPSYTYETWPNEPFLPGKLQLSRGFFKDNVQFGVTRHYPCNEEIEKKLIRLELSYKTSFGYLCFPQIVCSKIFADALRLVPMEKKKIMNMASILRSELPATEIAVTQESFHMLKCEHCGAGAFEKSVTDYETLDGTYSLLRCKYCGFEGVILKQHQKYKVAFPKNDQQASTH